MRYQELSYWLSTVDEPLTPRPPLGGDADADVVIVGAGYTGLWTAYYLAVADPALRITVLEREIAGFGASGRNGGWCSALFPTSLPALARRHGRDAALRMQRAMQETVREVGRVVAAEGIDCDWQLGGTVVLARSEAQLDRARADVAEARAHGLDPADLVLLDAAEATARCAAERVRGGTYTPHCAALHPARLVRGLARAVERRGVRIHERTPVTAIRAGAAVTPAGTVRAPVVVRATEGYTPGLPGQRRAVAPVYSLMVATEPLPEQTWARIGLAQRETFSDHRQSSSTASAPPTGGWRSAGGARRTISGPGSPPASTGSRGSSPRCVGCWASCSRCSGRRCRSATPGADRSGWPGTGRPRSGWTPRRGWPGRAGTSATGSAPRTSPDVRSRT
ncbi:Gamma-glutamylputrescine oxidoreductase [Micromonospora sp. MW-13]|nr:FAD-dependent oxidoreductase [Micromonospora sp. MW-13]RGC69616.1 Gamma-glutamylputrescine oxidoreductase [Micromonospora sp. MW-13]